MIITIILKSTEIEIIHLIFVRKMFKYNLNHYQVNISQCSRSCCAAFLLMH